MCGLVQVVLSYVCFACLQFAELLFFLANIVRFLIATAVAFARCLVFSGHAALDVADALIEIANLLRLVDVVED